MHVKQKQPEPELEPEPHPLGLSEDAVQLLADAVAAPSRPRAADDSFTTEGRDATIARVASDDPSET